MTRPIKFRAWDGQELIYFDSFALIQVIGVSSLVYYDRAMLAGLSQDQKNIADLKIVQYTGLTDRHGKEIYEGDIVEVIEPGRFYKAEVIFEDAKFLILTPDSLGKDLAEAMPERCCEVIGNTMENPELLEANHASNN